jgi:type IV secretory pathway VirB2 component (pilin)
MMVINLISGISSWRECLWVITGLLIKFGSTYINKLDQLKATA